MKTFKELSRGDLFSFEGQEYFMVVNYGDKGCWVVENNPIKLKKPFFVSSLEDNDISFIRISTHEECKEISKAYCEATHRILSNKLRIISSDVLNIARVIDKDLSDKNIEEMNVVLDDIDRNLSNIGYGITSSMYDITGIRVDLNRYANGDYNKIGER